MTKKHKYKTTTRLIHDELRQKGSRSPFGETAEALYLTSGFVYESAQEALGRFAGEEEGYIYSRYGNPTVRMFEERMIALEGDDDAGTDAIDARATASGMAAVTASLLCFLRTGDHVVSARALFGSCRFVIEDVLPRFGIEVSFVDGTDNQAWHDACRANTKAFFLETPSNPLLEIIDLSFVGKLAKEKNIKFIVDNVFATPILQKPFAFGADIVVYSATKHIDGQGRCLGGIIIADKQYIDEALTPFYRNTGPSMSPFNAWVLLKGLETLKLRVEAQSQKALVVAKFLEEHKKIKRVVYPSLPTHPQHNLAQAQMKLGSTLLAFEIKGAREEAFVVENTLEVVKISNNLGDTKSLITHPATTTHFRLTEEARAELGIGENLLRLSVGLEDESDICADLDRALQKIA